MRFLDEVEIHVQAGSGGNGCRSFLRQRARPKGGPDGGSGGRGGDVVLVAQEGRNTLLDLHLQKHYRAQPGKHGRGKTQHGRKGEDRVIPVPVGTLVRDADTGEVLTDLARPTDSVVAARGGRGGRGNAALATVACRAPDTCEPGDPGETRRLRCELKLLADVGIVGLPNAGKSTLISRVSAATPKIAPYPFTTLVPQLGLVRLGEDRAFVLADIPGILPGASSGSGLGLRFLRHIERSSVLLFLVDLADPLHPDPFEVYAHLKNELERFSPSLLAKQRVLALNKIDLPAARERIEGLEETCPQTGEPFLLISGKSGEGLKPLVFGLGRLVEAGRAAGAGEGGA